MFSGTIARDCLKKFCGIGDGAVDLGVYQEAVTLLGRAAMSEEVVMDMVTRGAVGKVIEIARSNDEYVNPLIFMYSSYTTLYTPSLPYVHPMYAPRAPLIRPTYALNTPLHDKPI